MKQLILMGLGVGLLTANLAYANLTLKLDLEIKLQEKIRAVISPVDPYAQVTVNAKIREISTELPGLNAQVTGMLTNSRGSSLNLDDVQAIEVKIISRIDPMPQELRDTIESSIEIPRKKVAFTYGKMGEATLAIVHKNQPFDQTNALIEGALDTFTLNWHWIRGLTGLVLAVSWSLSFLLGYLMRRNFKGALASLSAKLAANEPSTRIDVEAPLPRAALSEIETTHGGDDRQAVQSLPIDALVSLFSDCYWCEEDGYAAWLWNQLTNAQRGNLLGAWVPAVDYAKALVGAAERREIFHHHPYYLDPSPLRGVSQSDLLKWVRATPGAWSLISPLRQIRAGIPLDERIKLERARLAATKPSFPPDTRQPRVLETAMAIIEVTAQDEKLILDQPNLVTRANREKLASLVWVALMPVTEREALFGRTRAQDIAEAWVGHDEILKLLRPSIPDRKFALVEDYLKKASPRRDSAAMRHLTREAVAVLDKISGGEDADVPHSMAA